MYALPHHTHTQQNETPTITRLHTKFNLTDGKRETTKTSQGEMVTGTPALEKHLMAHFEESIFSSNHKQP
jgi:hypothetical protein